ncbi:hypothetical protein BLNAU_4433 [Blattamonas nauphoetae]|uniref:RRM domain-containing protein n=1 Tax=Blattamonas nauphoetae TaxID=2049346 RepID=A0ABQ9Y9W0_9EUKA|nr:hypothetical protein BLNAU_4433 [Blattamonas nauphoetae]
MALSRSKSANNHSSKQNRRSTTPLDSTTRCYLDLLKKLGLFYVLVSIITIAESILLCFYAPTGDGVTSFFLLFSMGNWVSKFWSSSTIGMFDVPLIYVAICELVVLLMHFFFMLYLKYSTRNDIKAPATSISIADFSVFAKGFPRSITSPDEISAHFSRWGTVREVTIFLDIKSIANSQISVNNARRAFHANLSCVSDSFNRQLNTSREIPSVVDVTLWRGRKGGWFVRLLRRLGFISDAELHKRKMKNGIRKMKKAKNPLNKPTTGCACITFESVSNVEKCLHDYQKGTIKRFGLIWKQNNDIRFSRHKLNVSPAPHPSDLLYHSLGVKPARQVLGHLAADLISVILVGASYTLFCLFARIKESTSFAESTLRSLLLYVVFALTSFCLSFGVRKVVASDAFTSVLTPTHTRSLHFSTSLHRSLVVKVLLSSSSSLIASLTSLRRVESPPTVDAPTTPYPFSLAWFESESVYHLVLTMCTAILFLVLNATSLSDVARNFLSSFSSDWIHTKHEKEDRKKKQRIRLESNLSDVLSTIAASQLSSSLFPFVSIFLAIFLLITFAIDHRHVKQHSSSSAMMNASVILNKTISFLFLTLAARWIFSSAVFFGVVHTNSSHLHFCREYAGSLMLLGSGLIVFLICGIVTLVRKRKEKRKKIQNQSEPCTVLPTPLSPTPIQFSQVEPFLASYHTLHPFSFPSFEDTEARSRFILTHPHGMKVEWKKDEEGLTTTQVLLRNRILGLKQRMWTKGTPTKLAQQTATPQPPRRPSPNPPCQSQISCSPRHLPQRTPSPLPSLSGAPLTPSLSTTGLFDTRPPPHLTAFIHKSFDLHHHIVPSTPLRMSPSLPLSLCPAGTSRPPRPLSEKKSTHPCLSEHPLTKTPTVREVCPEVGRTSTLLPSAPLLSSLPPLRPPPRPPSIPSRYASPSLPSVPTRYLSPSLPLSSGGTLAQHIPLTPPRRRPSLELIFNTPSTPLQKPVFEGQNVRNLSLVRFIPRSFITHTNL